MSTPDHRHIVDQVYARGGFALDSHDGSGRFCEAVVLALNQADPEWGHLKKSGAQNQYNGHAVDAALYRATGQTADFIHSSGDPDARPSWGVNENDHYPPSSWFAPTGGPEPQPGDPGRPGGSGGVLDENLDHHMIPGSAGRALLDMNARSAQVDAAEVRAHSNQHHQTVLDLLHGLKIAIGDSKTPTPVGPPLFALVAALRTEFLEQQREVLDTLAANHAAVMTALQQPRATAPVPPVGSPLAAAPISVSGLVFGSPVTLYQDVPAQLRPKTGK